MNITDILILAGILVFVLLGLRDGLLKKIFGILGVLGGLILATKFMSNVADFIEPWFNFGQEALLILAFSGIYLAVVIVVNLFYRWFGESESDTLKVWSRLSGGLLGALQGAVAVSLLLLMMNLFDLPSESAKKESALYDDVYQVAPKIFDYSTRWMPSSKKFFDELKNVLEKYKSR